MGKGSCLVHIIQLISVVHNQVALICVIHRSVKFHAVNKLLRLYGCRKFRSGMHFPFAHIHIKIIELRITVIYSPGSHNRNKLKPFLLQIVQNISIPLIFLQKWNRIYNICHF